MDDVYEYHYWENNKRYVEVVNYFVSPCAFNHLLLYRSGLDDRTIIAYKFSGKEDDITWEQYNDCNVIGKPFRIYYDSYAKVTKRTYKFNGYFYDEETLKEYDEFYKLIEFSDNKDDNIVLLKLKHSNFLINHYCNEKYAKR